MTSTATSRTAIDRRSLVKGALACTAAGTLTMAAGSVVLADAPADALTWDEEFDVVIVGGGLAGMACAVTVADEGEGASCLLLEKGASPLGGGNSPYSAGGVTYTDDVPLYLEYLKAMRGEFAATPDDVLEAFAEGIGQTRAWVNEPGIDEADLKFGNPEGTNPGEYGELECSKSASSFQFDKVNTNSFTHISQFMLDCIEQRAEAIDHRTSCRATDLVQDPQTREVLGVVYTDPDGAERRVRAAKGVVMCTGGFENDPVMKQNYFHTPLAHAVAGVNNTGDGHRMCMKAGADFWHMHSAAGFWTNGVTLDGTTYNPYRTLHKKLGITVAVNGRRFYMDYDMTVSGWPKPDEWGTLESDTGSRHGRQQYGGEWPLLPTPSTSWFVFDQEAVENGVWAAGEDVAEEGYGYKAQTIEELGELMGVPVDEFVEQVELWNEYCAAGKDLSFHRPASSLHALATPPFYAMKQCCELLNTDGGPVRSARAEILDPDGDPIPGLFSAGEFGSVWSHCYQGNGNLGECMVFGRIAARSALAR